MTELDTFIKAARKKGLTDERIRQTLESQGWNTAEIDLALIGLAVPKPTDASHNATPVNHATSLSTGPLHSALQHVLLWFFLGSASVSIWAVVASLFGTHVSSQALASMIAVTVVTFVPYAIFFVLFLRKTRRNPQLIPGKVWSIITICLTSIGAMAATITLVINLIAGGQTTVGVSAGLLIALNVITLVTYGFAAFVTTKLVRTRWIILLVSLPAFVVLLGTLFVMSIFQLGPARYDENLRTDLTKSVEAIADYTKDHQRLPATGAAPVTRDDISYTRTSSTTYKVCATFKTGEGTGPDYYSYNTYDHNDLYVGDYQFTTSSGNHCFPFKSSSLTQQPY